MADTRITLRLGEKDAKRLELLANHYALNQASVIRMLLKRAEDSLTAELGAKLRKASKNR